MKNTLLFFICLLTSIITKSQAFPTVADKPGWKIGVWNFWTGDCESFHWKYGKIVSICGLDYTEAIECNSSGNNCVVKGYVRIDSARVYVRKTLACSEPDRLMYNFALKANTSYNMAYNLGSYDSTLCFVKATHNSVYMDKTRLVQSLTYNADPPANNYTDDMQAIMGIGSDIHPFFPLTCFGDFCETNLQLMEYRENGVLLYAKEPVFPLPCKSWLDVDEKKTVPKLDIFPNPFSGLINISSSLHEPLAICIYDITSRKILSQQFMGSVSLDLGSCAKGVYLYEIKNGTGWSVQGKIIKE